MAKKTFATPSDFEPGSTNRGAVRESADGKPRTRTAPADTAPAAGDPPAEVVDEADPAGRETPPANELDAAKDAARKRKRPKAKRARAGKHKS